MPETHTRPWGEAMIDFTLEVEESEFLEELADLEMEIARKLLMTMDQVGWEVVAFLRSIGHGTRPPARPGEPSRSAHPGGWADVSSNLAGAYRYELYAGGQLVRWSTTGDTPQQGGAIPSGMIPFPLELRFLNGMEYAAALEARDGYWVIREITEAGGPVQRTMRTVVRRVDPDGAIEVL